MIPPPPRSTLFPYTTLFRSLKYSASVLPMYHRTAKYDQTVAPTSSRINTTRTTGLRTSTCTSSPGIRVNPWLKIRVQKSVFKIFDCDPHSFDRDLAIGATAHHFLNPFVSHLQTRNHNFMDVVLCAH